ncbi:hypothetical protein Tco_0889431 [Tanacetum coccineum]
MYRKKRFLVDVLREVGMAFDSSKDITVLAILIQRTIQGEPTFNITHLDVYLRNANYNGFISHLEADL